MYKDLPPEQKQIVSNTWVRELFFRCEISSIKELHDNLLKLDKRKINTQREIISNFWYLIFRKRAVTNRNKIEKTERLFKGSKAILDSLFWPLITINKDNPLFERAIRRLHWLDIPIELSQLVNKRVGKETSLTKQEVEELNSLDTLMVLLVSHHISNLDNHETDKYLEEATSTFLRLFAFRYGDDKAFDILKMIKYHLGTPVKKYFKGSPISDSNVKTFDDIKNKHHLSTLLGIMRDKAEQHFRKSKVKHLGSAKLTHFTHLQLSNYFS
jgi:hypothetical protein